MTPEEIARRLRVEWDHHRPKRREELAMALLRFVADVAFAGGPATPEAAIREWGAMKQAANHLCRRMLYETDAVADADAEGAGQQPHYLEART